MATLANLQYNIRVLMVASAGIVEVPDQNGDNQKVSNSRCGTGY
jgi:hypothetical protein